MFTDAATGIVEDFDEHRGDGHVLTEDGRRVWFHCTAIADGSRTIAAGTEVTFAIQPGLPGQWEATDISPR